MIGKEIRYKYWVSRATSSWQARTGIVLDKVIGLGVTGEGAMTFYMVQRTDQPGEFESLDIVAFTDVMKLQ